mgnify:CR=1 FL=1
MPGLADVARRAALTVAAVVLVVGLLVCLSYQGATPLPAASPAVLQRLAQASSAPVPAHASGAHAPVLKAPPAHSHLKLATVPPYSPAALALQKEELQKAQAEVASIVVSKAEEIANSTAATPAKGKPRLVGATAGNEYKQKAADALGFLADGMSKKKLAKIEAAARAAARKENHALFAADDALVESQKELGSSAIALKLLTKKHPVTGGRVAHATADMNYLIKVAGKDKGASKAISEATAAAQHNAKLMREAREEETESARVLGKDAVAIPSLGTAAGVPDSLAGAERAGKGLEAVAARGARSGGLSRLQEREFIDATKLARSRP